MEISRTDIDALNAVINVKIDRTDFSEKVDKTLKDYRKNANIPGFRKGHVPMGMIKKQYEMGVTAEEVNRLLQENLDKYIREEKLELLGNPLPKSEEEQLDWNAATLNFDFELGLAPQFEIKLDVLKKVSRYIIAPDKKMIGEQMEYLQKQYGKLVSQTTAQKGFEITAQYKNEAAELDAMVTFSLEDVKGKKNLEALKAVTVGDALELPVKKFFADDAQAKRLLRIDDEKLAALDGNYNIEIKEINERILAELNQELFDKLYAPGTVTTEAELKEKIAESLEKQFEPQVNQKLLNDITECLVEKTPFDLPADFLKRWMQNSGKEPLTAEQASEEYDRSEKGIRYQLIEGKIIHENSLQVQFEDLQLYAKEMIRGQMVQYGQLNPEEKELEEIAARILSNQEEARKLSEQLMSQKLLEFYKDKAPLKEKKVSFDVFVKEAYGKA